MTVSIVSSYRLDINCVFQNQVKSRAQLLQWYSSYIKVGWVLIFLVPSYQFTCLLQGGTQQQRASCRPVRQKHCHQFEATVLSSSGHRIRVTTAQTLKCWFIKIFHSVWCTLNHYLLVLFMNTQIPLGYLWNYLLIPKVLFIIVWIIVYLKISTELYYPLFTTWTKTDNRLHNRLRMCRGE